MFGFLAGERGHGAGCAGDRAGQRGVLRPGAGDVAGDHSLRRDLARLQPAGGDLRRARSSAIRTSRASRWWFTTAWTGCTSCSPTTCTRVRAPRRACTAMLLGPGRAGGLGDGALLDRAGDHALRQRGDDHARGRERRRQERDARAGAPRAGWPLAAGREPGDGRAALPGNPARLQAAPGDRRYGAVPPLAAGQQRQAPRDGRRGCLVRARQSHQPLRHGHARWSASPPNPTSRCCSSTSTRCPAAGR